MPNMAGQGVLIVTEIQFQHLMAVAVYSVNKESILYRVMLPVRFVQRDRYLQQGANRAWCVSQGSMQQLEF